MSSYSAICAITRQSITLDDPCYVLPLIAQSDFFNPVHFSAAKKEFVQHGVADSRFYPTVHWTPFGGLIEATYSSDGEIKLVDTALNRLRVIVFIREAVEAFKVKEGANSIHDIAVDFEKFLEDEVPVIRQVLTGSVKVSKVDFAAIQKAWAYLEEAVARHRLFARPVIGERPSPVDFAIIHESAVSRIVHYAQNHEDLRDSKRPQAIVQACLNDYQARKAQGIPAEDEQNSLIRILDRRVGRIGEFEGATYPGEFDELYYIVKHQIDLTTLSYEALVDALEPVWMLRYFMEGLDLLDLPIGPSVYAGDDDCNATGRAYKSFIDAVQAAIVRPKGRARRTA